MLEDLDLNLFESCLVLNSFYDMGLEQRSVFTICLSFLFKHEWYISIELIKYLGHVIFCFYAEFAFL